MAKKRSGRTKMTPGSMSMMEPRFRNIYRGFYKETYYTPTALDLKTKELIAIAASTALRCEGCLQGHIKKALALGLTKHEISDAIVVTVGIAAASMIDETDKAAARLGLHPFK